jgi:hypothetical protein
MGSLFQRPPWRLALTLALLSRGSRGVDPIPVEECSSGSYFDINSLLCTSCPSGHRVDASGFACECEGNTVAVSVSDAYSAGSDSEAHCVACADGLVPARARAHAVLGGTCLACGTEVSESTSVLSNTTTVITDGGGSGGSSSNGTNATTNGTSSDGEVVRVIETIVFGCAANATLSEPTLGECTAEATPDERCVSAEEEGSFFECACPAGYVIAETGQHGALLSQKRCEPCASNAYPSPTDPRSCLPCDDVRMLFDGTECACPSGWVRESHANGLWGRGSTCVLSRARDDIEAEVDTSVASRITYTRVLPATSPSGTATSETVDSATLTQLFMPAAVECLVSVETGRPDPVFPGRSACQALANLCVLADYNSNAPACEAYRFIQGKASGTVHNEPEWAELMPWLYYSDAQTALRDANLRLTVAIDASAATLAASGSAVADSDSDSDSDSGSSSSSSSGRGRTELSLVLNSYTINGTWLGLTNLTTELQLCGGPEAELSAFLKVGTSLQNGCQLSIADELAALARPLGAGVRVSAPESGADSLRGNERPSRGAQLRGGFHELYLRDGDGALFPVPVRFLQYPGGVNANGADASSATGTGQGGATSYSLPGVIDFESVDDVLTRRFFLVDALSGRAEGADEGELPVAVRYANTLQLRLRVSEANPSQMLPPLLIVGYADALTERTASTARTVGASFRATYSMDLVQYWSTVAILIIFACIVAFIGWLYACFAWVRRNQRVVLDGEFATMAVVHALGVYADVFFWLMVGLCAHWFVFFKGQAQSFIMLPEEEATGPLQLILALALVGKAVQVLVIVWRQSRADVFLIDWETAHGTLLGKEGEPADATPISVWR